MKHGFDSRMMHIFDIHTFFRISKKKSVDHRVRTRVGTHVFRIPSNSARGTSTDLRSTSIQTGDACMGLAYAPIWACICKCMQELGPAYVLAYRRSRCMAFLHGICMVFAWVLHGICMVFAWVLHGFAWYLHGVCMGAACICKSHASPTNRLW